MVLTEADVPPKPPPLGKPPCRSAYSTTAEFLVAATAHAELKKQRADIGRLKAHREKTGERIYQTIYLDRRRSELWSIDKLQPSKVR